MITINEQKIIAQQQSYKLDHVLIRKEGEGMIAQVQFAIINELGQRIDVKVLTYSGKEYDDWWNNFDSGKFLYEELELNVEIPEEVEQEFVNEVPEVEVSVIEVPIVEESVVEEPVVGEIKNETIE